MITEHDYSRAERELDSLKDTEAERQYLICMTDSYHSSSEKFLADYEMKMSELAAENAEAEKAAAEYDALTPVQKAESKSELPF